MEPKSRIEETFTIVYNNNMWGSKESRSGLGSTHDYTRNYSDNLERIIKQYEIESIVDCACGDWNWMKLLIDKLPTYLGIDIVKPLIVNNKEYYTTEQISFKHGNMLEMELPKCDLILVRHVFEHLSLHNILKFIEKAKKTTKYAIFTSNNWSTEADNLRGFVEDRVDGGGRGINLKEKPFIDVLGDPIETFIDTNLKSYEENSKNGDEKTVFGFVYKFDK